MPLFQLNKLVSFDFPTKRDSKTPLLSSQIITLYFGFFLFQMVIPKRAALLIDRIMVALHHALEDNDAEGIQRIANLHKSSRNSGKNLRYEKGMLQQIKGYPIIVFASFH